MIKATFDKTEPLLRVSAASLSSVLPAAQRRAVAVFRTSDVEILSYAMRRTIIKEQGESKVSEAWVQDPVLLREKGLAPGPDKGMFPVVL
ncbi:hypothetical protein [Azospirillum doebereinerae]|uniref:Uncharacterized protein n=1 Tax=Azospirillum doebereinerae TaxID=92933 RepID=A0A3S0WY25_9PROT|nr:hypothetical protein [Azospirillum doebereinerae]MCG5238957.1 hypothetical protein [Azospirillum doebereinerae]RUQ68824.1 hypothetical protein EJ913_16720 [Azospirillum doebereinerae]